MHPDAQASEKDDHVDLHLLKHALGLHCAARRRQILMVVQLLYEGGMNRLESMRLSQTWISLLHES